MGSYRYEILRETTTDSLIMENNTREKKMNSNVYGIDLGTCNMKIYCKTSNKILNEKKMCIRDRCKTDRGRIKCE